jgi:pyruvate dehydrogenase E2 component (dihydrolipoamide acetyltransferase)
MTMPHEIRIPRLGWSMEEGTFVRWLKAEGEIVQIGDPLFEFEGEKALQEIEALDAGILRLAAGGPRPGDVVAVGALIGFLAAEDDSSSGDRLAGSGASADSGRQPLHLAQPEFVPAQAVIPIAVPAHHSTLIASPRARRVARELAIDWTDLRGTGQGGRIREADVRAAVNQRKAEPAQVVVLSPRRKAITARLRAGQRQSLPVTLTSSADATRLVELRDQFRREGAAAVPTFTDLIVSRLCPVLKRHPLLAARWQEDHSALVLPAGDGLHIGIAVDTPEGLLVPVVRDAGRLSLAEIAAGARELIERARSGRLAASDMAEGAFTVSNLGRYGIESFTPLINYPEVAILGIGAIRREAVVLDAGQIVAQHRLSLSLTFDHGALDGAPAAAFLQELCLALADRSA